MVRRDRGGGGKVGRGWIRGKPSPVASSVFLPPLGASSSRLHVACALPFLFVFFPSLVLYFVPRLVFSSQQPNCGIVYG